MELESAIELLKNAVKNNATNDENHIDLSLVRADERAKYEKALIVSGLAIREGKITRDEFLKRIHVN